MNFFESDIRIISLKDWLDWAGGSSDNVFVALPMIQRGSVWKPNQIIELWDSLMQGMPIGSMMASELQPGTRVRRLGRNKSEDIPCGGGLGLIDGQQRTLAMLVAWQLPIDITMDRRIWVDFGDPPPAGQLLRLRVTTENQPFGFRRNEPSTKLSLGDRHKAKEQFEITHSKRGEYPPVATLANSTPWGAKCTLDLKWLIEVWRKHDDPEAWRETVLKILEKTQNGRDALPADLYRQVEILKDALARLVTMQVPVIRVHERFFKVEEIQDNDPPLALLFKRIGTGGTLLSDADYVYSIIKHLRPETYDLVESLNGYPNIASLLTATDLVMSAVRLAAIDWNSMPDWESPSKQNFHRLLQSGDFLNQRLMQLIAGNDNKVSLIGRYFSEIQKVIEYRPIDRTDIGIPRHLLPHLGRPLVQVLLRIAQIGYLADCSNSERRNDILRLVLFWLICVNDHRKASEISYKLMKNADAALLNGTQLGQKIHDELIERGVALALFTPSKIRERNGLVFSPSETPRLRGESRFMPMKNDDDDQKLCHFYRRWWRPWTHQHPILLWLQRDMVAAIPGDPMFGREEDTPYDYDHILPSSNWGNWRGLHNSKDRLLDFSEREYWVLGNGIGNVRVWDSSKNRSDGDIAPASKLGLVGGQDRVGFKDLMTEAGCLLRQSAIPDMDSHRSAWIACSRDDAEKHSWNKDRALAFQFAVESRAFHLYERYFDEPSFNEWYGENGVSRG
jgi:hypothetical protein